MEQTQIWYISIWASLTSASITESCSGVHHAQCVSYCSCHRAASHHPHCHPHFRFHSDLSEITPHRATARMAVGAQRGIEEKLAESRGLEAKVAGAQEQSVVEQPSALSLQPSSHIPQPQS